MRARKFSWCNFITSVHKTDMQFDFSIGGIRIETTTKLNFHVLSYEKITQLMLKDNRVLVSLEPGVQQDLRYPQPCKKDSMHLVFSTLALSQHPGGLSK